MVTLRKILKNRVVRFILYSHALLLILLLALLAFGHFYPLPPTVHHIVVTCVMLEIVWQAGVALFVIPIGHFWFALGMANRFDEWPRDSKYVNYILIIMLLAPTFQAISFIMEGISAHYGHRPGVYSSQTLVRTLIVAGLIGIGILIYLFKQASKPLYGMFEIAIALLTNSALISGLNLSSFPRNVHTADLVAIGLFTYLLSKGIGTTIDGLEEDQKRRKSLKILLNHAGPFPYKRPEKPKPEPPAEPT